MAATSRPRQPSMEEVAPTWRHAGTDAGLRGDATRTAQMETEADPMAQIGRGSDQGEAASRRPSIVGDGAGEARDGSGGNGLPGWPPTTAARSGR